MTTSRPWSPLVLAAVPAVRRLDGGAQLVEAGDAEHLARLVHADRLPGRGQHGRVQRGAQRVGANSEGVPARRCLRLAERRPGGQRGQLRRVHPAARRPAVGLGDEDPRLACCARAFATVASAGSTGFAESSSPPAGTNDSRLMPRSKPNSW